MKTPTTPLTEVRLSKVVLSETGQPVSALIQAGRNPSNRIAIELAAMAPDARVITWLANEARIEVDDIFRAAVNDAWPEFRSELLQKVQSLVVLACFNMMADDREQASVSTIAAEGIKS